MIRRTVASALVALAAGALAGCDIPPIYRDLFNTTAPANATHNILNGEPKKEVLCSIPPQPWELQQSGTVIADHGWLIPSDAVQRYGCTGAFARAIGTSCDPAGCHVNDIWWGQLDGNPYIDPPGHLPG